MKSFLITICLLIFISSNALFSTPSISVTVTPTEIWSNEKDGNWHEITATVIVSEGATYVLTSITFVGQKKPGDDNKNADFGTADLEFELKAKSRDNGRIYTITYTATDGDGKKNTATATVTVTEPEPPVLNPPTAVCQDIELTLDENGEATITAEQINNGSTADAGIASLAIDKTNFDCSNVGNNTVTLTVTDENGNTDECTAIVTVVDDTNPTITVTVSPATLWPPNNKMQTIEATVTVTDNCGGVTYALTSITSNETITNDVANASYNTNDLLFDLRAKRNGNGNGRIYTITYTATDASFNTTTGTATVTVPHDNRKLGFGTVDYNAIVNFHSYPNPTTDETTIEFTLPEQSLVTVKVYNMQGNLVNTLHEGMTSAGYQMLKLNTRNFPAGEYTVVLTFGSEQFIHKIMKEK